MNTSIRKFLLLTFFIFVSSLTFLATRNIFAFEMINIFLPKDVKPDLTHYQFLGDSSAPVVIVDYFNFSCNYCDSLRPVLDSLLQEYPGKIKLYAKPFPLEKSKQNLEMVKALIASAKQNMFWEMLNELHKITPPKGVKFSKKEMKEKMNLSRI